MWSSFNMQNSWVDHGGEYFQNGYRRTKDGVVVLHGLLRRSSGSIVSGEIIGTLPVGYRPSEQLIFQTSTNPNAASRVDVCTDGTVRVLSGDPGWLSLDGIKFLSSDAPVVFTNLTPQNNWVPYGSPFSAPAYAIDADGRVHVKGLVKNGVVTDGTPIVTLPVGYQPLEYNHIAVDNTGASGFIGVDTNKNIVAKGGANGYLSLQSIFYTSSYTDWHGMTLQNGWVYYGSSLTTPAYTKATDGLVSLKGLIKTGTVGTTITTLPAGYRPAQRILYHSVSSGVYYRLDINSNGDVICVSGNNGWMSLDGVVFYADN